VTWTIIRKIKTGAFTEPGRHKVATLLRRKILRSRMFVSGPSVTYRMKSGRRFVVHEGDTLSLQIYGDREYDDLETRTVEGILRQGDIAIDAGANIGYYAALMSNCVGRSGRVYAFEPGRETFAKLQQTIEQLRLRNVTALRKALDRQPGEVSLWASNTGHDAQQALHRWPGMEWVGGGYFPEQVDAVSLDLVTDEEAILGRIAFAKIDVEGQESYVLEGARRLLASDDPPVLLVEVNRAGLEASGSGVDRLLAALEEFELFFAPLSIDQPRNTIRKWRPVSRLEDLPGICNLLTLPKRGRFASRCSRLTSLA
jgi:FkbM family methyltransferase